MSRTLLRGRQRNNDRSFFGKRTRAQCRRDARKKRRQKILAWGNGSNFSNLKFSPPSPTRKFVEYVISYALVLWLISSHCRKKYSKGRVLLVNEAYTSAVLFFQSLWFSFVHTQTCSFCHSRMAKNFFSPKGNRVYRLKRCSNTNCLTQTSFSFSGVLSIFSFISLFIPHSVLFHLLFSFCLVVPVLSFFSFNSQSKVLHRDKNACRNIEFLFKAEAQGGKQRPSCFARSQSNCLCFSSSASPQEAFLLKGGTRGDLPD